MILTIEVRLRYVWQQTPSDQLENAGVWNSMIAKFRLIFRQTVSENGLDENLILETIVLLWSQESLPTVTACLVCTIFFEVVFFRFDSFYFLEYGNDLAESMPTVGGGVKKEK